MPKQTQVVKQASAQQILEWMNQVTKICSEMHKFSEPDEKDSFKRVITTNWRLDQAWQKLCWTSQNLQDATAIALLNDYKEMTKEEDD